MTRNNKKHIVNKIINDFDAVSCYPSSMSRISGYIKGKAHIYTKINKKDLSFSDYYYLKINITKIGI